MENKIVFGYVNGKAVYSSDEFVFACRGFGAIETDEELLKFAEKKTYGWSYRMSKCKFSEYFLSDYCMDEPARSLTKKEFNRLKELQMEVRRKEKEEYDAQEWKYSETIYWADNSVEEVWVNKYGEKENRMIVGPHGDVC